MNVDHYSGEHVKELSGLLLSIGHYPTVEKLYASSWAPQQASARETLLAEFSSTSASPEALGSSLHKWHDALMLSIEAELQWCDIVLPEHSCQLIVHVLKIIIREINGYGDMPFD